MAARPDQLGFKRLTLENWTEADPVNANFGRVSPLVGPVTMTQQEWARDFLSVELGAQVPVQVRDLFAVARGGMLYGWFFYPLFRLGEEQLYRVVEAAARTRYRDAGGSEQRPAFHHVIEWLVENGHIPLDERERWMAAKEMRNRASHPERANVVPPGFALRMLKAAARDIDGLFSEP